MKKFFMTMLLAGLVMGLYADKEVKSEEKAEKMITVDFNGAWTKRFLKQKRCVIKDGVLSMSGNPKSKHNRWRFVSYTLKFKEPANKKFKFGGEIKGEKLKGAFRVGVRLIGADGKSITYKWYSIKKDQDWQKFSKTFTANSKTKKMQFYFLASNLDSDSVGSIKNIYIQEL